MDIYIYTSNQNTDPLPLLIFLKGYPSREGMGIGYSLEQMEDAKIKDRRVGYVNLSTEIIQCSKGSLQCRGKSGRNLTLKAVTDGQNNDENQGNDNTENDQFYFHILKPHLPPHFSSLCPEILSLK